MDGSNPSLDGTGFAVAFIVVCIGLVLTGVAAWLLIREAGKAVRRRIDQSNGAGEQRRGDEP